MWSSGHIVTYRLQKQNDTLAILASKAIGELTEEGDRHSVCMTDKDWCWKEEKRLKCQHDNKGNGVLLLSEPMVVV